MSASGELHESLWSIDELSAFLCVPVKTLYQWRYLGTGPRAYRVGRRLRYDPAEVSHWVDERPA